MIDLCKHVDFRNNAGEPELGSYGRDASE